MKKPKKDKEIEKPKKESIFEEIMEKPSVAPKTSRHRGSKHFTFLEGEGDK